MRTLVFFRTIQYIVPVFVFCYFQLHSNIWFGVSLVDTILLVTSWYIWNPRIQIDAKWLCKLYRTGKECIMYLYILSCAHTKYFIVFKLSPVVIDISFNVSYLFCQKVSRFCRLALLRVLYKILVSSTNVNCCILLFCAVIIDIYTNQWRGRVKKIILYYRN